VRIVRSATAAGSSGSRIAGSSALGTGSGNCCARVEPGPGGSTEPAGVASCR
jgi:hypothetical protein